MIALTDTLNGNTLQVSLNPQIVSVASMPETLTVQFNVEYDVGNNPQTYQLVITELSEGVISSPITVIAGQNTSGPAFTLNKSSLANSNTSLVNVDVALRRVGSDNNVDVGSISLPISNLNVFLGTGELNRYYTIDVVPGTITKGITEFVDVIVTPPPASSPYWDAVESIDGSVGSRHVVIGFSPGATVGYDYREGGPYTYSRSNTDTGTTRFYLNTDWRDDETSQAGQVQISIENSDFSIADQKNVNVPILVNDASDGAADLINPSWNNDYPITSDRTNVFQFRKDMRNALLDVLDSSVRESFIRIWNEVSTLQGENVENWSPAAFESSERTRLIDAFVVDIMQSVESVFNIFGERELQQLYADVYQSIETLRNNLNELIDTSLTSTANNLERSEELLNLLQQKVDKETLMYHTISLGTVPKEQIKAYLTKSNTTQVWDITDRLFNIEGQMVLDFSQLKQVAGDKKENYFQSWYIKVIPRSVEITQYVPSDDRTVAMILNESDVNILGGTLIDANGKSYKVINKEAENRWLLTESIDSNIQNQPLTFIFNYFEPQVIELKFGWQHNYIPKSIPFGIELPEFSQRNVSIEEEAVVDATETKEDGDKPEISGVVW